MGEQTARRHRQEILTFLNIRKLDSKGRINLISLLVDEIFPKGILAPEALEYSIQWLHENKIQSPAISQLERIIAMSYSKFRETLFRKITKGISHDSKIIIDHCLEDNTDSVNFSFIKSDPGRESCTPNILIHLFKTYSE